MPRMTSRLSAVKSVRLVMAASIVPKHGEGALGCSYMWFLGIGAWLAPIRTQWMPGATHVAPDIVKCGCQ